MVLIGRLLCSVSEDSRKLLVDLIATDLILKCSDIRGFDNKPSSARLFWSGECSVYSAFLLFCSSWLRVGTFWMDFDTLKDKLFWCNFYLLMQEICLKISEMDKLGFKCLCSSTPELGRTTFLRRDGEVAVTFCFLAAVWGVTIDYFEMESFCIKLSLRFR